MKGSKLILLTIAAVILSVPNIIQAQSLPGVQTVSVKAPKDIKIDGIPTEWPRFEAYNKATECFYTISNDDNNLYLVILATYHSIVSKIVAGGITFTIKNNDKNSRITPVAVTYPYIPNSPSVDYTLRSNKILSERQLSTLNDEISGHVKEIPLTGAKGINDASISIYNELGIKANGLVDRQGVYTCEIAIPLKYIQQVFNASGGFNYRIQVNGLDTSGKDGTVVVGGRSADPSAAPVSHDAGNFLLAPTYLEGSYTLAK